MPLYFKWLIRCVGDWLDEWVGINASFSIQLSRNYLAASAVWYEDVAHL